MQQTEIYTKDYCAYCQRAKKLLDIKGISFVEHDVTRDNELENQMRQRAGRHTVPQIFIGEQTIGGFDELYALDQNGELDRLLDGSLSVNA